MKVWIGDQEQPASEFSLWLSGCDRKKLKGTREASRTVRALDLRKMRHNTIKLGKKDRAGSILSKNGHVHYRSFGQRVQLAVNTYDAPGAIRMLRGLEAFVLQLQPEEVLLGDEGESVPYMKQGALFVRMIHTADSPFQRIQIGEHPVYGRMLFLNGETQIASSDEALYSYSLVTPAIRKDTKRVLILGGGDCGVLREVLTHPVDEVVMIEIDEQVVKTSAEYFPQVVGSSRTDPRARIVIGDAFAFLEENKGFDLIVYDLSDMPLELEGGAEVFGLINAALNPGGRAAIQCSSGLPMYGDALKTLLGSVKKNLAKVKVIEVPIPSFLEQPWVFAFGRKK